MVQEDINKQIERGTYYLKYYDEHKCFPFKKKRIYITLSDESLNILKQHKNKSKLIESLIQSQNT